MYKTLYPHTHKTYVSGNLSTKTHAVTDAWHLKNVLTVIIKFSVCYKYMHTMIF